MHRLQRFTIGIVLALPSPWRAAACGGGSSSSSSSGGGGSSEDIKGQTITVLVPYMMPQKLLDQFTAADRRQGQLRASPAGTRPTTSCWSPTRRRPTSPTWPSSTGRSPASSPARSWVEPLEGLVDQKTLDDLKATDAAFISGGKTYAACYSNDFRVSMYNKAMFAKAGIDAVPGHLRRADHRRPEAEGTPGVQYPLSIPMAATEGGVTPVVPADAGDGRTAVRRPEPADLLRPRLGRVQGAAVGGRRGQERLGLARLRLDGRLRRAEQVHGRRERDPAGHRPRQHAHRQRPQPVEHRRQGRSSALVPGIDGPGGSFGLPEGLSIPVTAKHKAAAAAFIEWWERPENAIAIYKTQGSLPCGATALKQLADSGQLQGGDVVSAGAAPRRPAVPGRRADLVLAVQLRRAGPAELGGQG